MTTPRFALRTGSILLLAFLSLATLFCSTQVFLYLQTLKVQRNVDEVIQNSQESLRLIARMETDIFRERLLVDRHIFEETTAARAPVEQEISRVKGDYAAAVRQYEPLSNFLGEAAAWRQLQDDIAAAEGPTSAALDLSRRNLDEQAQEAMRRLEPRFAAIEGDVDRLVAINQKAADQALARVIAVQRQSRSLHLLIAILGGLATLGIGLWVHRLLAERERLVRNYATTLEARNRDLDAFAGRVAHDLRGPLSTISLAAQRLLLQRPEEKGVADILHRGVQRMEGLIEDLLTLSQIEAQARGKASQTDAVVSSIEEQLSSRVKEAGGTVHLEIEPAQVRCSEGLLRTVLWNLGENAVKYRRPEVALNLEVVGHTAASSYEFRVTDNGAGMTSDETRQAFEPFFRGGQGQSIPGTGLGLSIVRRVIEASGGTVSLASRPQQGTTVVIRLPVAAPA